MFTFANGQIKGKAASFGKNEVTSVVCQAAVDGIVYAGSFKGEIFAYAGPAIKGVIKAHASVINAMVERSKKKGIISGGKDGKIIVWASTGSSIEQEKTLDILKPELKCLIPEVNSVCESKSGNVLVGTRGGEILEFFPTDPKPKVHLRSHCKDELWGLAVNPKNDKEFITVGQDNVLAIWDISNRRQKKFAKLDCPANCVTFSSDGAYIGIGYTNGTLTILDSSF